MDERELIEYQDVMDALSGIKTFIPGTFIYQKWRGPQGPFQVRYKVLSRTAKMATLIQMPAGDGYQFVERCAGKFRMRVKAITRMGCEGSWHHQLFAVNRCA